MPTKQVQVLGSVRKPKKYDFL
ncbi:hypothetical protein DENIT_11818 [Pseudomonas veronii]|nr:hypothetical protein DENIT_11818 [Pseudomonas veronii]